MLQTTSWSIASARPWDDAPCVVKTAIVQHYYGSLPAFSGIRVAALAVSAVPASRESA